MEIIAAIIAFVVGLELGGLYMQKKCEKMVQTENVRLYLELQKANRHSGGAWIIDDLGWRYEYPPVAPDVYTQV